ncbi:MAG TPA: PKD domain-containing protein [Pyrinomonadaceae bacterium]|nr:PKD domain-containing protein [Pyrinomonadaceae bacterium]
MDGTVTDDGYPTGSSVSVTWSKVSGPGTVTFGNASSVDTTASFSVAGTYVLQLTASDSLLSNSDEVTIVVQPENQTPTANAGADQSITLPASASLNGSTSDDGYPSGSTMTVTWSKFSGPGNVTFSSPNTTITSASFSAAGTYVLRLTASDGQLSASDDTTITVIPQNFPPTVNAGADQSVTLPGAASLNGSTTDDGLPAGSTLVNQWSQVSGPGTTVFANASAPVTTASFDLPGTYVLRLTSTDSQLTAFDELTVMVIDPRVPPTANFVVPESTGTAGAFVIAASGATSSAFSADKILDDSNGTFWNAPGSVNQFAKIQFFDQQSVFIDRVRLQSNQGSIGAPNLKDFQVQISSTTSDDASFVTVLNATQLNNGQLQEFMLPGGPTRAKYLKLIFKNNYGSGGSTTLGTFNPVAVGSVDSLLSLPGLANVARMQSPGLIANGASIYSFSYGGGTNNADGLLGYNRGGFFTTNTSNQFAIIQLGGDKVRNLKGVRIATDYNSGFGAPTAVKDFEVWVSATTPDDASFTKVLTAATAMEGHVQTFMFPGGAVPARYVKYVPLTNHSGGATLNTNAFDVVAEDGAQVVGRSGEYEHAPLSAEQAFDGDINTQWLSPNNVATNVWVKVSLADDKTRQVYGFRINPVNNFNVGQRGPKDIDIRVSTTTTDDAAFTTVYSGTLAGTPNGPVQEILLSNPVDAKYVQFFWKNGYSTTVIGVSELEVLSAPDKGSAIVSFTSGSGNVETLLDLDPTNQPWQTPNNSNANVSFTLLMPRGELATFGHIAFRPGIAANGNYGAPKDFQLQVSTTDAADSSFTTAFSGTLVNSIQMQDFYFTPVQARYVRLVLVKGSDFGSFALHNFLIYSSTIIGTTTRFIDRSSDADGQVVSWAWSFGDGTTSTEKHPTHTFAQTGDYTVSLTVTDNSGLTNTYATVYHVVDSIIPDFARSPIIAHEGGENVRFTDIQELLLSSAALRTYNFGDGSALYSQYAKNILKTYDDSGVFHVTLRVGDPIGIAYTVTRDITVLNMPPSVDIDPGKTVVWGEPWTSVPRITDQSSVDRASLQGDWAFGDGQTSTCVNCTNANATVTHAYNLPGTYTAVLTIRDKDGGVGSDNAVFTVNKRPTTVTLLVTQSQNNGDSYLVRAKLTDTYANLALPNKTLQFALNGVTASATTDASGIAEVSFPFAAGAYVGQSAVSFVEDALYLGSGSTFGDPLPPITPPSGASHKGKDFWIVTLDNFNTAFGSVAVDLYLTSEVATSGTVTQQNVTPVNFTIPANGLKKVPAGLENYLFQPDTIQSKGIHIVSQDPISVVSMNNFSFTSDAFLALPAEALGTDYIVLGYANGTNIQGTHFGMVATQNGTSVTITPSVTTGSRLAGVPFVITLNQGQTYYLRNDVAGRENDLSGTLVSASKPVAVFGGHKSGSVPDNVLFADHLVEQLPPTNTWGKHFVTMPYKTRTGGDTFRFMAAGDATSVYVNGQRVALLNRGQFHERIIDGPAYIVSDKPILVAQYSNGAFYDHLTGDPSMAIIPPYEQYLNSYVVANPDFGNVQFLNVIAPTSTVGSVILDGAAIAASTFTPISTSGFSGAQISVARGAHQLTGPSAFGVSVYGFGQDDAYGFPGGMTFRSTVPTTGLVLTPNSSSAAVGTQQCVSASLTDQFGIPVGGQSVVFSVTGANPSNSSGQTNAAGQAGLCYAGANIGLDTITATVGTSQATATIAWTSPNQPPIVNAGADQTITGNSANLLGSVSDDGLPTGSSLTLLWTKVSGPGNVTFGNASFATTTATFTAGGVYVLRLTANDTQLSSSDEVTVTAAAPDARGSDFWLMFPVSSGSADTLTLLISGENETTGTVSAPGIQFVQSFAVHPGTVTQVVIPNTAEQLFTNFVDNKGIHVTAQKDVAVYGLNYHTFTTEGYLGLPVDVLGTEYITLGYKNGGSIAGTLFSLVATANNTVVDITPSVDTHQFINGVDTIVQRAGVTYRINLNQGETYQLVNTANSGDLSGSSISANNPIAVFGGHNCANVPANFVACNHLVEQLPSIDKWGTNFLTVPLAVRTAGDTFRVIASRDNTHVSVNGVVVATLNRGQFDERTLTARSVITADQPIMVAQYSNSFTIDNTDGDPFMMLVPPVEQFASSYTIATPANGFPNNYMNVVVPNAALGSLNLDGSIVPTSSFAPIGSSGYSGAQLSIGVGSHTISNTTSFGAGIYGFASFDTYGYPAGMALSSIALAGRTTLTPRSAFGLPGNQTCLTATVRDQNNNPIANTAVNFNVTGANTTAGTAPTDAFGQAQFCYAGINPGFDAIVATSTSGSDQATRYWQPPNQAPTVNAGPDQHGPVTVCTRQEIPLQGSVTDDGFPVNAPVTVNWTAISGPGPTNFTNNTAASTTATFNVPGTYVLRLTASDTQLSSHDDVQVVVDPAPVNQPPTVDAGPAQTVSMGTNLIQNPSNEKQLVNGEIPDWSEVASQSWTQAPAGTNNLPASRGGATYFYTENNGPAPTSVLSQDVDVSSRPSTAGNIVFSGYLRVRAGVPNASAQVTLEFINKNKNFSLGQLTFDPVTTSSTWQLVEANAPIPAGTAWIRLRLNSDGPAGGNGAGFFDALSLRFAPTVATTKLVGTISDDGLYCGTFTQRWDKISGPGNVGFGDQTSATTNVSFDAPGTYVVRFTGDDAYLTSTSDVTIAVNAAPTNLAPVVNAGANQTITLPTNFVTLSGTVTDDGLPEGINLLQSWSKVSGPGNVAFADASATATTATFSAAGTYVLRLTGDDSALTATSDVTITVNPETTQVNQPPTVNPGPNQSISLPTDTVTLSGVVTDDGLPSGSTLVISWTKVSGPGNVTFGSANSAVTAAQFSAVGSYVLRLSASDSAYLVSADVGVILAPQNFAPAANAGVDQTALLSQPAQLDGSVSDDGLPAGSSVTTIWSMVSGPGTVTFDVPNATITGAHFSATGTYVLRLTANDSQLSGSDDVTITVIDDVAGPTVELTAPLDGDSVTEPTIVTGSVSGGAWILEYSLASDDNTNNRVWTQFASGNGAASGTLGTLDPTMMLNGLFTIRLSATDAYGQTSRTSLSVIVERNLKVGNFTVSFTDLTVPVAGVPMEVTRTYDTRDKRVGDFGFGWTLGLHNIRVEKSSVLGLKWYETVSQEVFPNYCLEAVGSHVVTVTFPGGKVFKFQPTVTPQCQRITPITSANISFAPMTGTVGRLEVVGSSDVQIDGSVPGPVNLIGFGGGVDIFNSFVFKFTAEDGTAYLIDQRSGLQSIADQNGNTVTIGNGGILHSNGKSITFARDGFGRITSITDPNGNSMTYAYDLNGDLVSYTDNENNTSTYTYDANHRLLTIHDPRGIQPIRNDYDAGGRLISHTDGFGKVITYVHDIVGRVESVTDRLGHTMTLEYDERGNIVRKTDARGGVSTFTFDSNDNVLTETNPLNRTTTYTYDANNHRLSITDPLNNITQFTYNAQGRVLTTTDPLGHVITNTFNGAGNVLSSEDAQHGVSTFVYSVFDGQMISMTDALNQTTHYNYTGGYLTKETDALGREKTYTYDANANRSSETLKRTNALGQLETITTGYEYDRLNRLQKTIFADGSTTQVEYNSIGHQSATIDQLGRRTEFVYDEMGRLTRTTYPDGTFEEASYDAEGRRLTLKDRAGHVTSNSYDELGRPVKTTFVDGTFTRTSYDAAGHELSTTDPRGNVTSHTYDAAGRMTKTTNQLNQDTTFTYDGNRNQLSMTDALNHATTYEYDLNNRRTKTIFADSTFSSVAYDALGRTVSKTDQAGKTAEFTYDAEGRLIKVKDTVNQETTYSYDEIGQQISQTDANNHTTRFEYDQLGRRVKRILPGGQFETYAYDNAGNLSGRTDCNGKVSSFSYDLMNRLLVKTPDASLNQSAIGFTYNALGQRVTMNDASGATSYSYDVRNRLTTKQTPFGTLSYTYDEAGNLLTTRSSNQNGASVDYSYDPLNRLSTVKDNHLIGLNGGLTSYAYDTVGNLQGFEYPNGVTTSYVYDTLNRLATTTVGTPVSALASYSYTLGPSGNRTAVTELSGRTVNYTYDQLYRLTSESITNDPHGVSGSITYSYDPVGNRLSRSSSVAPVSSQSSSYDVNDRLINESHDNNGNTTAANGHSYAYDSEDHLVSADGSAVTYVYDGDGNRVKKTVAGITTQYLVDSNNPTRHAQVLDELVDDQVVRTYVYGNSLISQRQLLSGLWSHSFYGYDGQTSVRFLTNTAGVVTDSYTYDAFGSLVATTGSTPNERLYTGEQYDANIGFYNLRSRLLRPDNGRFLTMDSFEGDENDPASLHKYLYVNANPVNFVDPEGYLSNPVIGKAVELVLRADFIGKGAGRLRMGNVAIITILRNRGLAPWKKPNLHLVGALLRPDLIDFEPDPGTGLRSIYEIKPVLGKVLGILQMYTYLGILNGYDPGWGPGSEINYTPPPSFNVIGFQITTFPPDQGVILYETNLLQQLVNYGLALALIALVTAIVVDIALIAASRGWAVA